ncbi:MAG: capsule biosynthesis protein CapI [Deltaproteobacteria bacterium RBG_19FT_COMBO_46_9]|nr:MAG: capsule biosynthesis protein CapI [Deltaproteobacteria bacterium RBG_19FT_COMBO_46_9]
MKILVTGSAGFIGSFAAEGLVDRGDEVIGLDSINDYYDVNLKYGRLEKDGIDRSAIKKDSLVKSSKYSNYSFIKMKLEDRQDLERFFKTEGFDMVCHMAAQAGVRYSITNPHAYIESNIVGFQNILEACRYNNIRHLVYASSSSVYGLNENYPFSTHDNVDHPISIYAATKKSNELMAHAYSHLYGLPTTGLRFFTVYGPWGRPDMALFIFTKAILEERPIDIYNNGKMKRDFTYIDDIIGGIINVLDTPPKGNSGWSGRHPDPSSSPAPYRIYNIGRNSPVSLMDFIDSIERSVGKRAKRNYLPMQPGDVPATWADVDDLVRDLDYSPHVQIREGVERFVKWYMEYFKIEGRG